MTLLHRGLHLRSRREEKVNPLSLESKNIIIVIIIIIIIILADEKGLQRMP
jgi:hypothetical protein